VLSWQSQQKFSANFADFTSKWHQLWKEAESLDTSGQICLCMADDESYLHFQDKNG